jgi:hypothetical protein
VITPAGTWLLDSEGNKLARQLRQAVWFASEPFEGRRALQRRAGAVFEAYQVGASVPQPIAMHQVDAALLLPAADAPELATAADCRGAGRCNVELRPGATIPWGAVWTGLMPTGDLVLRRPWQLCRRGEALEVLETPSGWLEPAVGDIRPRLRLVFGPDDLVVRGGGQQVAPPACAPATAESRLNKTVVGGRAPRPIMGLFVVRGGDAKALDGERDAQARFELAGRLAVRKWVYGDRWCDDAVRQTLLINGQPPAGPLPAEVRRRYWNTIVARHAQMYREYDRAGCERALQRQLEAHRAARQGGHRLYHFGY